MKRVLITDPISPNGLEILTQRGLEVIDVAGQPVEKIIEEVGTVHGTTEAHLRHASRRARTDRGWR